MDGLSFRSRPVQDFRRLVARRPERDTSRLFVIEGPKLLAEAVSAGAAVDTVLLDAATAREEHRALAARSGARVVEVAGGVLARACDAVAPQPVAAVVTMVDRPIEALGASPGRGGPLVICVDLQDPGNAGSVVRSAAASGATAVVFCEGAVDVYNPKAVRASAGALFRVPLVTGRAAGDVLDRLGGLGVLRVATVPRGGRSYDELDLTCPVALVLGSESRGIPAELAGRVDERVSIPMHAGVESINVAMAATVICFEAARQRRAGPR